MLDFNSSRPRAACGLAVSFLIWASAASPGQELVGPFELAKLPTEDAALARLQGEIDAEIKLLELEVEPKPDGASTQPSEAEVARGGTARELLEALKTYRLLLQELRELRTQVHDLGLPERAAESERELAAIRSRISKVREELLLRPPTVTMDELREAEKEYEAAAGELAARIAAQDERARRFAGSTADRDAAALEVQKSQAAWIEIAATHESKLSAATGEAERSRERYRLRLTQIALAAALVRAERVELEAQRDGLLGPLAERRIPLLREWVEQLQRRRDLFKQVFARNFAERVRDWVDFGRTHPDRLSPYAKAHWDVCLSMVSGYEEIVQMQDKSGIRDRFTEESGANLARDLAEERELWVKFMGSLERRPGSQIKNRFQQIEARIAFWEVRRAAIRAMAESTYEDRAHIETRLDEIYYQVRERLSEVRKIPSSEAFASEDARLRQDLAGYQQTFERELQVIRDGLDRLAARLDSAIQGVGGHIVELSTSRSRLYWSYLLVRDQPLWKYRPRRSLEEWRSAGEVQRRREDLAILGEGVTAVTPVQRGVMAGACLAALGLATVLRQRLFRHADVWEERVGARMKKEGLSVAPLSDRVHFQGVRFLARTALMVWPCLVAWACVRWTGLDSRFLGTGLAFLIVSGVAAAFIRTLFPRSRMRFRILPCSNAVAMYYRRWLFVLFWTAFILVPVPLFLSTHSWAPYTRSHLWAAAKVAVMLGFLVFAADRQTVLKVAGRPESVGHRMIYLAVSGIYPLMYVSVIGLLVAQAVGYSAFTTYVFQGLALSTGILFAGALLQKYIGDRAAIYRRQALEASRRQRELEEAAERNEAVAAAREVEGEPARREAPDGSGAVLWVSVLASLLRWGIAALAIGLVLRSWGVRWIEIRHWMVLEILAAGQDGRPAITVGRALLAILVVILSWMASRTIRSVLETQVFPTYAQFDRSGRVAVTTLLHYLLVVFGFYFALATLRIPLGALTVVLGTIGLGVGLGLQPLVLNFFSGLVMLFERHLKVGDLVEVDGQVGEVTDIRMRATSIRTADGVDMIIPNGDFISRKVVNWTLGDTRLRGELRVNVAYDTDPRLVERLLLSVAGRDALVLADPPPRVRFVNFGENSLDFALHVWFNNAEDRYDFVTDSRYRIVELFKEHDVEIPFPQRTFSTADDRPIRVLVETSPVVRAAAPREPRKPELPPSSTRPMPQGQTAKPR